MRTKTCYEIIKENALDKAFVDDVLAYTKLTGGRGGCYLDIFKYAPISEELYRALVPMIYFGCKIGQNKFWCFVSEHIREHNIKQIREWKHIEEFVKGARREKEIIEEFREFSNVYMSDDGTDIMPYKDYKAFNFASAVDIGTIGGCFRKHHDLGEYYKFCIKYNREPNDFDL